MNKQNFQIKFSKSSIFNHGLKIGLYAGKFLLILMILVANIQYTPTAYAKGVYDFTDFSNASQAVWQSGAGVLPFPGEEWDPKGFALIAEEIGLEGEMTYSGVLETHPEQVSNGYILGSYPSMSVLANERLIISVGFSSMGYSDGADFQVKFVDNSQNVYTITSVYAEYDGRLNKITTNLSNLAGKVGQFVLVVNGGENTDNDNAVWVEAYIDQVTECDLAVDDIWISQDYIYYRITNIGSQSLGYPDTPIEFVNTLSIGGIQASVNFVNIYLAPGESVERKFDYRWQVEKTFNAVEVSLDVYNEVSEVNENNNSLEKIWHVTPDLIISHVTWAPEIPGLGQYIPLTINIRNLGNMTALACKGSLLVGGSQVQTFDVPKVIPWGSVNVGVTWGPVSEGANNLSLLIDSENVVSETNEDNNSLDIVIYGGSQPPPETRPDLAAGGVSLDPVIPKTNKVIFITPLVDNLGVSNSTPCKLRILINDTAIGTVLINSIPANSSLADLTGYKMSWVPTRPGRYVIQEIVDIDDVVDESNENNNIRLSQINVEVNDEQLPIVNVAITPDKPTELDSIFFSVSSTTGAKISSITLYLNETELSRVDDDDSLKVTTGPYEAGTKLTYWVRVEDTSRNVYTSPLGVIGIASSIPIDGKVIVEISPPAPNAADEIAFNVKTFFQTSTDKIRLYLNGTLYQESTGNNNHTFIHEKLHAGSTFTYEALAISSSGDTSRTARYEILVTKAQPQISISLKRSELLEGGSIELSGVLSPPNTQLSINLIYSKNGSTDTKILHADASGIFNDVFKPEELGEWVVTAAVYSNKDYFTAESQPTKFVVNSIYSLSNPAILIILTISMIVLVVVGVVIWRKFFQK